MNQTKSSGEKKDLPHQESSFKEIVRMNGVQTDQEPLLCLDAAAPGQLLFKRTDFECAWDEMREKQKILVTIPRSEGTSACWTHLCF